MNHKQSVDLLVTNGDLFTGERRRPRFRPGAVAISKGAIRAVGSEKEIVSKFQATRTIDAHGGIVHPGFADTHLHLMPILIHGLPFDIHGSPSGASNQEKKKLPTYAQIKVESDDEITSAFTAAAAVALLRRGFTFFMEAGTVFETDAFADTLTRCGMRGLVSSPYGWDDASSYIERSPGWMNNKILARAPADARRVIDECKREIGRNRDEKALVQGYVCLYGSGTATDELISASVTLAGEYNVLFSQHQAFTPWNVSAELQKYGETGVSRLNRLGALNSRTTLAHMNILSNEDANIVMSTKPGIVWCPNAAMRLALYPTHKCYHPSFYKAGLSISLGIDTTMSDSLGTSGLASLLLAASVGEPLQDSDPFYMQTIDAANNMLLGDKLGSMSVGKRADLVIRSVGDITHTPLDDYGSILSLDSTTMPVDTVFIDGRIVMKGGRMTTIDQDEVMASALHQRERLFQRAMR